MLELYIFLALVGVGYMLNKQTTQQPYTSNARNVPAHEIPSVNNAYDASYFDNVQTIERRAANRHFAKADKPEQTGVIDETVSRHQGPQKFKSMLAGVEIPYDDFQNNMVPFFGSSVKQNVDPNANRNVVERFTGQFTPDTFVRKREQKPFFELERNNGNVNGMPVLTDYYMDRMVAPVRRANEKPFESIHVGPGLNNGYTATPSGGFQSDDRAFVLPKTVDELRVASNPKETFGGRVISGQKSVQRGQVGEVVKNRTETFYENSSDRYFTTVGAVTGPSQRPVQDVKDTNRQETSKPVQGGAYAAGFSKAVPVHGAVKDSSRQQNESFGFRNIDGDTYGNAEKDDYGKGNILPWENERDLTTGKSYQGNLTALVKSLVAPIEDIFRDTRKEYTVQNARPYGEMQRTFPEKITVKDPNDVLRTTIKETNIHDTVDKGNIKGAVKTSVYDPTQVSRTTVRQTLPSTTTTVNLRGGTFKGTTPNLDKANTTMKETTIDGQRYGNIDGRGKERGGYEATEYDARITQKQFTSDRDYFGGVEKGQQDGYKVANVNIPITQKQVISDNDYIGGGQAIHDKKPMSYDDIYNAQINELKETTLVGREPTKEGVKLASGADSFNVTSKKLECDGATQRENQNMEPLMNEPVGVENLNITKLRDQLDNTDGDRMDINIMALSQLKENPYAQKGFA
jgi:hypothetical protein